MSNIRIPYAQLQRFMTVAMERLGLPSADASVVGNLMAEAELQGSDGAWRDSAFALCKAHQSGRHEPHTQYQNHQ